jgi:hypothetical protein
MRISALVLSLGLMAAGGVYAQETQPFSFAVGGGYTNSLGSSGRYLDNGWNVQAGGGFNFNSHLGAMLDFNYNSLGINSATLGNLGAPGGGVHIMSFTIDPIVHVAHYSHVDFYLIGGGGLYHRYDNLTAPSVGFAPVITPLGFFNTPVVGETVLASYSINKPGFDAGAGIAFGTKWHAKVYAEARYNRMLTSTPTDFIPVTFGVRW